MEEASDRDTRNFEEKQTQGDQIRLRTQENDDLCNEVSRLNRYESLPPDFFFRFGCQWFFRELEDQRQKFETLHAAYLSLQGDARFVVFVMW